jgi:gliding motility-associated protein GldE
LEGSIDPGDPLPISIFKLAVIASNSIVSYTLYGIGIIVLLILSAVVSGAEVAFFSLSAEDINRCKMGKKPVYKIITSLLGKPRQLLASILVFNNLVNVGIVMATTYLTWDIIGTTTPEGIVFIILTVITTFAIVFFGEIVPKIYANQNSFRFACQTARFLLAIVRIFKPFSWLLISFGGLIDRRIERKGYQLSAQELNDALEIAANKDISSGEKEILKGIVNFSSIPVKQIMRTRMEIVAFNVTMSFPEVLAHVHKNEYSRIPVYKETIDEIKGILYGKDLLPYLTRVDDFDWTALVKPGYFVPETKKLDDLLRDFQQKRVHMAIVVDEYGGTAGLVTLDDIIEQIFGEIQDEFDEKEETLYHQVDAHTYIFEGKTSLSDFYKVVSIHPEFFEDIKADSESIGGLLLELFARIPKVGDYINYKGFEFTTVAVDQKRIKRIKVHLPETAKQGQVKEKKS